MPCGRLRNIGARLYNLLSVFPAKWGSQFTLLASRLRGNDDVRDDELKVSLHSRLACQSKRSNSADWKHDAESYGYFPSLPPLFGE
jgi:hypothetical protein